MENEQLTANKLARQCRKMYRKEEENIRKERWKEHCKARKFLDELERDLLKAIHKVITQ